MDKDRVKGAKNQAAGSVKETVGKVTGDKETEAKGKAQKVGGKVRSTYGDVKEDVKKATR